MSATHFNLADLFEMVVDTVPTDRVALVCGEARLTYAQLDRRANQLAHYLQQQGVGPDDHVGLFLYNCNEYIEAMLACFKIRAVPINVNYRYVDEELLYIFDNADLVATIHGREFVPRIAAVRNAAPRLRTCIAVEDGSDADLAAIGTVAYEDALASASPARDFGERSDDDLFILYTGGTTGLPKGVMWPHRAMFYASLNGGGHFHPAGPIKTPEEIRDRARENPYLVGMPLAPLMHGACWWYACITLLAGHTVVINPNRSLDGAQVWDIVEREKVNTISLVGDAMAVPLLDALEAHPDRWDLGSVFGIGSGGAVFSESVQHRCRERFPNVAIHNAFGSSETGAQGGDNGVKSDGLGRIPARDGAGVITADLHEIAPGSGEQGYLARSGNIPVGYYKDPEKTARTFVTVGGTSWVLTGDLATVDADGTIIVYGRGSNCINSGGEKIFPEEVEQAIKAHPAVFDALVVATPDARFTEKVTAVVQLRERATLSLVELQAECRKHIAGYKVPRELHITDHVSRAPSGKPDYKWAKTVALEGEHRVD